MTIAKVKLDESTKLEFGVSITGASGTPQSRLVIEGKEFAVSYPCKQTSTGVEADITGLKNVFTAGEYPVRLEIVIENKIYTPFHDTIVFEPGVEVTTQPRAKTAVNETVIKVNKAIQTTITEHQDKAKVASAIANTAGYFPSLNETPEQIVENVKGMISNGQFSDAKVKTLEKMISLAEEVGVGTFK